MTTGAARPATSKTAAPGAQQRALFIGEAFGIDIGKGALSAVTVASRSANSARIARRVGSASAENTRLS